MADAALRRTVGLPAAAWLESLPPASRFIFRGAAAARTAAGRAFGLPLPETACRAATDGNRAPRCGSGPDEQLLLAPDGEVRPIEAALARALDGQRIRWSTSVTARSGLSCTGRTPSGCSQSQCPLPLNLRDFPVGMCTRTVFAKAEIVLWRTAEQVFRLEVWRSFATYVVELLREIDRESVA